MPTLHVLRGSYRGQLIEMDDATATAATADGWGTDPAAPVPLEDGTDLSQTAWPQSLLDFEATGKVEPPDPPEGRARSRKTASRDDDE